MQSRIGVLSFGKILLLGLAVTLLAPTPVVAADKVKMMTGWVPYARDLAFFAAKGQGLYKAAGLEVEIIGGKGSADSVRNLVAKTIQFGFPDTPLIIKNRAKGGNLKLVAIYQDVTYEAILALKSSGIRSLRDLEGRKLGLAKQSSAGQLFPAFARMNKLNVGKIREVNMTPGALIPSLISGKVDAAGLYTNNVPIILGVLKKRGKTDQVVRITFASQGLDIYSNGIGTTDELIANNPDLVRRFTTASMQGAKWAIENREDAIKVLLKFLPNVSPSLSKAMWDLSVQHMVTDNAKKNGIGHIDPKKMEFTRKVSMDLFGIKKVVPLGDIYTLKFLPKILVKL